jgi:hypothetical protein
VYNAAGSKVELLHLVVDAAVAGDSRDVMLVDRPDFAALADLDGPPQQVEVLAGLIAATMERLAPIWRTYHEAAAADPAARDYMLAAHRRRYETFGQLVATIDPAALRRSPEHSLDCVWSTGSIDVFLLFRDILGWTPTQYSDWLRTSLTDQLLAERCVDPPA